MPRRIVAGWPVIASFFVSVAAGASVSVDICQAPVPEAHLSIGYSDNARVPVGGAGGTSDRDDFRTDFALISTGRWQIAGGHRSAIFNIDGLEPQTNGYLHTFFVAAHRFHRSSNSRFRFTVAPGLSGSSNITKDPAEYTMDALQLLAAAVWQRRLSDHVGFSYGICGDHRFGGYRVYPVAGIGWQPHADWNVELGFPTSRLHYRVSKQLASALRLGPNGNEWYVKDRSADKYSRFVYEAYLLEWALDWRAQEKLLLTVSVGREFHRRYEMTLRSDARVRLAGRDGNRAGVSVRWFF